LDRELKKLKKSHIQIRHYLHPILPEVLLTSVSQFMLDSFEVEKS